MKHYFMAGRNAIKLRKSQSPAKKKVIQRQIPKTTATEQYLDPFRDQKIGVLIQRSFIICGGGGGGIDAGRCQSQKAI